MKKNRIHQKPWEIITLSADDSISLTNYSKNLLIYLKRYRDVDISDVAYTLNMTQKNLTHREAIICSDITDAIDQLSNHHSRTIYRKAHQKSEPVSAVFMFPGLGNQYSDIAYQLYEGEHEFKKNFDFCSEHFNKQLGINLQKTLFLKNSADENWTKKIEITLPTLFSISYSLAKLWISYGITPQGMIGHSIGEFVSATISGVLPIENAISYISKTVELTKKRFDGEMMIVHAEQEILTALEKMGVTPSSQNTDTTAVYSGKKENIDFVCDYLDRERVGYKRLGHGYYFHSLESQELYEPLLEESKKFTIGKIKIPYISCETGDWITESQIKSPDYWAKVFINFMPMNQSFRSVSEKIENPVWIELGSGASLSNMMKENLPFDNKKIIAPFTKASLKNELKNQQVGLANAWLYGFTIDWSKYYYRQTRCLMPLPKSPFSEIYYSSIKTPEIKIKNTVRIPTNQNEKNLLKIFEDLLNSKNIGIDDNFFECGGDSISVLQCIARASEIGIEISLESFMRHPTISYLANQSIPRVKKNDEMLSETNIPLLPLQARFFTKPKHWSEVKLIPCIANLNRNIDLDIFEAACRKLVLYHDALNLRFAHHDGKWRQFITNDENFYFDFIDFSCEPTEKKDVMYAAYLEDKISKFNLENGFLIKFLVIDTDKSKPYHFILAFHHLCIDGVSFQVLLQDILCIYNKLIQKNNDIKITQTTSFKKWAYFLNNYANSTEVKNDLEYWVSKKIKKHNPIPIDFRYVGQKNLAADIQEYESSIELELSRIICKEIPKKIKNITVLDVLLTAFVFILNDFTKSNSQLIDIRRHGRDIYFDEIDLTKTVGWLTVVYPIFLSVDRKCNLIESIYSIHEQLSTVPQNGLSYGLLRYAIDDESVKFEMENLPRSQVAFNYHGIVDSAFSGNDLFSFLKQPIGNNLGSNATRSHLFNIDLMVRNDQINIVWTYSKKFHKRATIQLLQEKYQKMLKKVALSIVTEFANF